MPLKVARQTLESGIEVFHLAGSLTLGRESQNFEWSIDELVTNRQNRIVVNLADVAFVDSAGIGILVGCHGKIAGAGGQFRLANVNSRVQNVLRVTSVDSILLLDGSVDDSVRAIGAGA